MLCDTRTRVPPWRRKPSSHSVHLCWKASSPTASTSSTSSTSGSTLIAIENPSRICMPDEYVRRGSSIASSSSAKATMASKRRLSSARVRPSREPLRKTFSRPVYSG